MSSPPDHPLRRLLFRAAWAEEGAGRSIENAVHRVARRDRLDVLRALLRALDRSASPAAFAAGRRRGRP